MDEGLGFAPTELFDLFQRQRAGLLTWLESNPEAADGVLEEVVRVLTLNSAGVEEHDIFGGEDRDGGKRTERTARGWFGLGKDASAESLGDASNDADAAAATKISSASEGKVRHTQIDGGCASRDREALGGTFPRRKPPPPPPPPGWNSFPDVWLTAKLRAPRRPLRSRHRFRTTPPSSGILLARCH